MQVSAQRGKFLVRGEFLVVNDTGGIEVPPTVFHEDRTSGPSVSMIDSNSVFISFRDDNDGKKGKYVVVDPMTGEQTISEQIFHEGSTNYNYYCTAPTCSTVFIAYRDDSDSMKGNYVVLNPLTGSTKIEETTFASEINSFSIATIDPARVLITYQGGHPVPYSYFKVINPETGDTILQDESFEGAYGIPTVTKIDSLRCLIVYRDTNNVGKLLQVNARTGEKGVPRVYTTSEPFGFSVSSTLAGDNLVALFYWTTDQQVGKGLVYHLDDFFPVPETTLNTDGSTPVTCAINLSGKLLVAYRDDPGDGGLGKLRIYDESLNALTEEISIADTGVIGLTAFSACAIDSNSALFAYTIYLDSSKIKIPLLSSYHIPLVDIAPNPLRTKTTIRYTVSENSIVAVGIYYLNGKLLRQLSHGNHEIGSYEVSWDGNDSRGKRLSAGVYLCRIQSPSICINQRIILLK